MITKHFNFGWHGVKAADLQTHILAAYLRNFNIDKSNTVLINTTWLLSIPNYLTSDQISEKTINFANNQYEIFAGASWPKLSQILTENVLELPLAIKNEILEFKSKINEYQISLEFNNHNTLPIEQVKKYINKYKHEIDIVIVYSFLDPPRLLSFLDNQPFSVIRIGGNPNYWLDFHAMLVDKFFLRDTRLSITSNLIDTPFMCLNGKPRNHRHNLVRELLRLKLDKLGLVSFGGMHIALKESSDYIGPITIPENHIRPQGINYDPFDAMSLGDIDNWNRHFLNIVTETVWDVEKENWWSEKIFKPIIGHRPFLVYAPNGCTNMLVEHGFQHYCNDFTDISNLDLTQPDNIPTFLKQLSSQPTSYLKMKYDQLNEKILFNSNRYTEYVKEQWETVDQGLLKI
jgi:hypothetical protein